MEQINYMEGEPSGTSVCRFISMTKSTIWKISLNCDVIKQFGQGIVKYIMQVHLLANIAGCLVNLVHCKMSWMN